MEPVSGVGDYMPLGWDLLLFFITFIGTCLGGQGKGFRLDCI